MRVEIRCLILALAAGLFAWPATAACKQGALFDPQLEIISAGTEERLHLYVFPLFRGEGQVVGAPSEGTVPIEMLHLLRARRGLLAAVAVRWSWQAVRWTRGQRA